MSKKLIDLKYDVDSILSVYEDITGKLSRVIDGSKDFEDELFAENYVPDNKDVERYVYDYPKHKRTIEAHNQLLEKYLIEIQELNERLLEVNNFLWDDAIKKADTSHENTLASDEVPATRVERL